MKYTLAALGLLLSLNASAFTLNNSAKLTFAQDEVKVNLAGGFCANLGISDEEFMSIIGKAVDSFWNKSPTSRLKLRKGSIVNVDSAFHTDTICTPSTNCTPNPDLEVSSDILISCNTNVSNFSSAAILGVTIPNNISGDTIYGSLVLINDQANNQFKNKSTEQKASIIAHELGHAFGLGHSPVEDSLMYYATMANRKNLGRDDIDGISYLYPKKQPFSGCGTVDFNGGDKPNYWGGLFIGFALIALVELMRKKRAV